MCNNNDIHVVKGTVFYYLKIGKNKIAKAFTLGGLQQIIEKEHNSNNDYLVAIDIARTQERGCQSQKA